MPVRLPFEPPASGAVPSFRIGTVLRSVQYLFDVYWNGSEEAWYMHIRTADGTMIRAGIKIVLGVLLGRRTVKSSFPFGVLIASDTSNSDLEATFDDFGKRVQVWFYTAEEFVALASSE